MIETSKSKKGVGFVKTGMKSPQKEKEKDSRQAARTKDGEESTSKLLEKVEKAIQFKKKDTKEESPSKNFLR